jgi:hypothetical protein
MIFKLQPMNRFWTLNKKSINDFSIVVCFMYFVFFQEFLGVLAINMGFIFIPKLIPAAKYFTIVIAVVLLLPKITRDKTFSFMALIFFVILIYSVILSTESRGFHGFMFKIAICLLMFFIGKHIRLGIDAPVALDTLFWWLSVLTVITGLVDYFYVYKVTQDQLLKTFKVAEYFNTIKGDEIVQGLPGNLYGSFSMGWFTVRRLGGLFFIPLTFAYFASFLLFYQLEQRRWILVGLLFLTIALTITRAILIPVPVIIVFHLIRKAKPLFRMVLFSGLIIMLIIAVFIFSTEISELFHKYMLDSSGQTHLSAISSILSISFVNMDLTSIGLSEGVWWTIIRLGGIFCVLFILMLLPIFRAAKARTFLLYTWLTYLFTSILSLQVFSPTSVLLFWFVLGMINNRKYANNLNKSEDMPMKIEMQNI